LTGEKTSKGTHHKHAERQALARTHVSNRGKADRIGLERKLELVRSQAHHENGENAEKEKDAASHDLFEYFQNLRKCFVKQVYHQIRSPVDQDQIAAHDTVCQFVR
jgi:hypothetical protein